MIERFIALKNIGKFVDCRAAGDVTFREMNLIYGENGRGKTTLCDVIRSLSSDDGDRIKGRTTLGESGPPRVEVLVSGEKRTFADGAWSSSSESISVFDSTFVHENIYAGDVIDHEHKKNLYRVIVGEKGVTLAHNVDAYDTSIRETNRSIKAAKQSIEKEIPTGVTLKQFLSLEADAEVEKKITQSEANVSALKAAATLKSRTGLAPLQFPTVPKTLPAILSKTLNDVSADAEETVRNHVNTHLDNSGEEWLATGVALSDGPHCPYCGQDTIGISLVEAYQTHFSEAYRQLKCDVQEMRAAVRRDFNESKLLSLQKTLAENQSAVDFWSQFIELPIAPTFDVEMDIGVALAEVRRHIDERLTTKFSAPLDAVDLDQSFAETASRYDAACAKLVAYGEFVAAANALISAKKKQVDADDLPNTESGLALLRARKVRHESAVASSCRRYNDLLHEKGTLETQKAEAKKRLDEYSHDVFGQYETRINRLLEMFNAGFRITGTKRRYVGGTPSSTYELLINDVPVEIGDEDTPHDSACFKNTLSAGDRSTLALAFFLARIERDPLVGEMVVVFDDPFTSQDRSRRTCTQQQITRLARMVKQVIVMSHEPTFLRTVWDAAPSGTAKTLQLARLGQQTTITEWNIQEATSANYVQMHSVLTAYRDEANGDRRHVAQTIRPLLENYLRMKLPREFGDGEWLGDFIRKTRECDATSPLDAAKTILEEVEEINDYSKKYHHNTNSAADTEPIDDGELESFVKRTLELVGGF